MATLIYSKELSAFQPSELWHDQSIYVQGVPDLIHLNSIEYKFQLQDVFLFVYPSVTTAVAVHLYATHSCLTPSPNGATDLHTNGFSTGPRPANATCC